jgi:signal transduction histidine kinase
MDKDPYRLLIVDASAADAALLATHLRAGSLVNAHVDHASSPDSALDQLADGAYDAVLLDLTTPPTTGPEVLDGLLPAAGRAAVVVLITSDSYPMADAALQCGAADYLVKGDRRTGHIWRVVVEAVRRRRAAVELDAAREEQLAEKGRFLSHISHELRSPLAVAYQFGSLLEDGIAGPMTAEQDEMVGVMMRNLEQLNLMIDDLLHVAQAEHAAVALDPVVVPVSDVVGEAVAGFRLAAGERGLTLTFTGRSAPDVVADPRRVRQIVANLIENSLKFTASGGRIDVLVAPDGDAVRISVRDTGRGVREADLSNIFERFFQGKQPDRIGREGLGLGLYVCRDLVERQGGRIAASSELGRGTTISFTLPIHQLAGVVEVPA